MDSVGLKPTQNGLRLDSDGLGRAQTDSKWAQTGLNLGSDRLKLGSDWAQKGSNWGQMASDGVKRLNGVKQLKRAKKGSRYSHFLYQRLKGNVPAITLG